MSWQVMMAMSIITLVFVALLLGLSWGHPDWGRSVTIVGCSIAAVAGIRAALQKRKA